MAYNILNGTVEFSNDTSGSIESMVNTWQAQTINGNKVFVQTLSASSFRSDAGVIVPPAITAIASDGANRVITSDGDATATAHANVTIVGSALTASFFSGSGVGLTNVRSTQLTGLISGSQLHIGAGLTASGDTVAVSASSGIAADATGVGIDLLGSHGLVFSGSQKLAIDPSNPAAVTAGGQSLSDDDSFIIYDLSRTQTRKATANNIYSYVQGKLSTPAITSYTNSGDNRIVTSVNSNTVNAETNLTFDGSTLIVNGTASISGPLSASAGMHISGTMPKLAIGSNTSTTNNSGMLTIRPDDTNNRVLMMVQRTEGSDNRIVLAATGSGQVIVGGPHLDGVFNVSGSTAERLISAKSNTLDPAFYVDGDGELYNSGSHTLKAAEPGIFLSSSVDSNAYARFMLNSTKNILVENQSFNKFIVFKTNDGGSIKEGFRIGGSVPEVVVNEGSDSLVDFRVESNANTHMIFSDGSANKVGINNNSPQLTFDVTGDVGVSNHIALNCSGTVDPTLYVNHAHIYSKLETGTAEVYVRDSDGNVTKISPHTSEGEWEYFSRNTRTGKVVRVNMERMIRKLEEFTGESFMDEWYEEPTDQRRKQIWTFVTVNTIYFEQFPLQETNLCQAY